jgi:hypothetical protein
MGRALFTRLATLLLPLLLLLGAPLARADVGSYPARERAVPAVDCVAGEQAPVHIRGTDTVQHLVGELAEHADGLYEKAAAFTGATDCAPVDVLLTPNTREARHVLPAWHLPPWAAGAARPDARQVFLAVTTNGQRQDRERVLLHELGHLATASAAGGERVPRWFDEGVARRLAGEDGMDDDEILARARLGGRLIVLEGLEVSFPAGQASAAIAYAVSGRAIELLESEHGSDVVRRILARVSAGEVFDEALHAETGRYTWKLSGEVERSVALWHAWMTVLKDIDVGLLLGAFVLLFGGWRARRRIRERIDAMPDPGAPQPPPVGVVMARWTDTPPPEPVRYVQ